jgi:hypothetical protein
MRAGGDFLGNQGDVAPISVVADDDLRGLEKDQISFFICWR